MKAGDLVRDATNPAREPELLVSELKVGDRDAAVLLLSSRILARQVTSFAGAPKTQLVKAGMSPRDATNPVPEADGLDRELKVGSRECSRQ